MWSATPWWTNWPSVTTTGTPIRSVVEDACRSGRQAAGAHALVLQVLSGGVVLQLAAGHKVWLESFKDQQKDAETSDPQSKTIIFSGFLIFPE